MFELGNEESNRAHRAAGLAAHRNGETFEQIINIACSRARALKKAKISKTPEPMHVICKARRPGRFEAYFEKQAQPDYQGTLAGGRSIVFEAKHTTEKSIRQDRLTEEQMHDLQAHMDMGAVCFVLISFNNEHFYAVPFNYWMNMPQIYGKVSVNERDLLIWEVPDIQRFWNCKAVKDATKEKPVPNK